ncbi:MAG TPA: alpha/beta hydrolase [Casimicrobiaceae bacterium]|nr:alpha/beta hydrolase [Casimicrobiaceae bacterium]
MTDAAVPALTAELVERGYNNRAAVPEHPQFFAEYTARSKKAVAALTPQQDLRYGPNAKETLDLFVPRGEARGTLAFFHGGYWRAFDKADFAFVAAPFVTRGFAVAVLNYDLCPVVSIATIVDESRRATQWLAREGPRHGAPAPLVISGHSAGGQLVAMLFATDWRAHGLDAPPFIAGVTLSGVHDLEPLVLSTMNADLKLDTAEARRVSPIHFAPRTRAPLYVAAGADETSEFLRQSQLIFDAWPANRPVATTAPRFIPDRNHFTVILDYANPASELTQATLALFPRG